MMKQRFNKFISKFSKKTLTLIAVFLFGTLLYTVVGVFCLLTGCKRVENSPSFAYQKGIADQIIRFHVIGNSDTDEDQNVKLIVKEGLVDFLQPYLKNSLSKEDARSIIDELLPELSREAEQILKTHGFSYGACAELGFAEFPVKTYGDIVLPPGEYDALRIMLGDASGKNWWCILFPQLCFVDETYSTIPDESKTKLKYLLTEEEYESIMTEKVEVKVKFRLFDWLEDLFS